MTEQELIAAVRKHAEKHWGQNGWDFLVECWSDEDIANCIAGAEDEMIAIMRCAHVVSALDDQRSEHMAMAEW